MFRLFPVFTLYLAWGVVIDGVYYFSHNASQGFQLTFYRNLLIIDSIFQFFVLLELSRSVFRPLADALPRWFPLALGSIILVLCASTWPLVHSNLLGTFTGQFQDLYRLQQAFAVLRIVYFVALTGLSQFLSLSWRDRELQIATGLGIYSMVSVTVSVMHTHPRFDSLGHHLDQAPSVCYTCSLLYWIIAFSQKEAVRREFTPQMQSFLLAMAGNARATRMAMTDARNSEKDHRLG
jgi:hypothetical protein